MTHSTPLSRRGVLARMAAFTAAFTVPAWTFAEELTRTPAQTEGPFYPDHLPLDTDNDLLVVNENITPAVGTVTHLTGRILDAKGEPLKNALVEIWQCDANGAYPHSKTGNLEKRDANFQGFGRFMTGSTGEYYFRTIKPVPYPGRTPHIHVKVKRGGKDLLTTQCYIKGFAGNERDGIFRRTAATEKDRAAIEIPFEKLKESKAGELAANFVVVLGVTPEG